ncbi:calcium-binding protein [Synechococcus sp. RS9907]|uniref:calcium-binding protein n=1 Tax=Synechococcus sp. RS9907 TaxID=221350 RepID=UPI00165E364E|nr:calcium-binding protein [Synechococcus sp. RS9907]
MGREQKRDVILEVTDIHNNTILEYLTVEPTAANTAVVEYISFAVEENDAPIASISLIEEFNEEAGSKRDIFSINDLSIAPAKEILFLHSIDDISTQKSIKSFTLNKPVFLGNQDVYSVITGTNKKDKITGTPKSEILSGMKGKDILKGGKGADGFLFHPSGKFGNKHTDLIKDYDSYERDSILLDNDHFDRCLIILNSSLAAARIKRKSSTE